MAPPLLPEFFALLGIDVFLAISLLTSLLDRRFPAAVPYVYQLVALAGFGHILVSKGFISTFGVETRFWYCLVYLGVAVANVIAINVYIAVRKNLAIPTWVFSGAVTFPTILVSIFFVSAYVNGMAPPLPILPLIPMEFVYVALVLCAAVLGAGVMVSLKPEALGKLGLRRSAKVEARAVTEAVEEANETTGGNREVSQAGKPAPVTRKRLRLTPGMLRKIRKEREVK